MDKLEFLQDADSSIGQRCQFINLNLNKLSIYLQQNFAKNWPTYKDCRYQKKTGRPKKISTHSPITRSHKMIEGWHKKLVKLRADHLSTCMQPISNTMDAQVFTIIVYLPVWVRAVQKCVLAAELTLFYQDYWSYHHPTKKEVRAVTVKVKTVGQQEKKVCP